MCSTACSRRNPTGCRYWRTAAHEINYRRFFDVNELGGVRVELGAVFERVHGLLGHLLSTGAVDAVRIDHADGLNDPTAYFTALQRSPATPPASRPARRSRSSPRRSCRRANTCPRRGRSPARPVTRC